MTTRRGVKVAVPMCREDNRFHEGGMKESYSKPTGQWVQKRSEFREILPLKETIPKNSMPEARNDTNSI